MAHRRLVQFQKISVHPLQKGLYNPKPGLYKMKMDQVIVVKKGFQPL